MEITAQVHRARLKIEPHRHTQVAFAQKRDMANFEEIHKNHCGWASLVGTYEIFTPLRSLIVRRWRCVLYIHDSNDLDLSGTTGKVSIGTMGDHTMKRPEVRHETSDDFKGEPFPCAIYLTSCPLDSVSPVIGRHCVMAFANRSYTRIHFVVKLTLTSDASRTHETPTQLLLQRLLGGDDAILLPPY